MQSKLIFALLFITAVGRASATLTPTFLIQRYRDAKLQPQFNVDAPPVQVGVYYETRCPDSVKFINEQLFPAYTKLGDTLLNITFVPYGKAITIATPWQRNDYVCQHGVEECIGNNLHACYLLNGGTSQTQNFTVNFINCQMNLGKWTTDLIRECADQFGIDSNPIEQCAYGQHIYPLYVDVFADATHQRQKTVKSVPFITIDGVQRDDAVESGFLQAICAAFKGNKPTPCKA